MSDSELFGMTPRSRSSMIDTRRCPHRGRPFDIDCLKCHAEMERGGYLSTQERIKRTLRHMRKAGIKV